jgi:hypothetical protein
VAPATEFGHALGSDPLHKTFRIGFQDQES